MLSSNWNEKRATEGFSTEERNKFSQIKKIFEIKDNDFVYGTDLMKCLRCDRIGSYMSYSIDLEGTHKLANPTRYCSDCYENSDYAEKNKIPNEGLRSMFSVKGNLTRKEMLDSVCGECGERGFSLTNDVVI